MIAVDDGSTDDTEQYVMNFMTMGGRTKMRYTKLDGNHGICTVLNVGYRMADANDVVRMDNSAWEPGMTTRPAVPGQGNAGRRGGGSGSGFVLALTSQ